MQEEHNAEGMGLPERWVGARDGRPTQKVNFPLTFEVKLRPTKPNCGQ
jgi:hypothetical protein